MSRKVRIGIDVGGTFTDAVLIDNATGEIIDKDKIPTSHYSENGVAQGIIDIVKNVMTNNQVDASDVVFIAHGTTQATNALLEGDVAKVGVVAMGSSKSAKRELSIDSIELAPNKYLEVEVEFINSKEVSVDSVNCAIDSLLSRGCEVFVASEEYSIDNNENELFVVEEINKRDLIATAGHAISELYGLKVRTKTSIVNASLIPKMLETANMTEKVVKQLGIESELMIMRADGGVMSINEVRKRPILTMLSGLAAGVAGALIHEKITDGVFMEVGGTSIDISVIKNGKVIVSNASVGNHKTYLKALDVRTLAVAGGSMIRVKNKQVIDVGPRSAHLAHREYECFGKLINKDDIVIDTIAPLNGDSDDYLVFDINEEKYAYTLCGASNFLGYIDGDDYAFGNQEKNKIAWEVLGEYLGADPVNIAQQVVDIACEKVWKVIDPMIKLYELDYKFLTLVGGGGSAAVVTNPLAKYKNLNSKIASNAPFISTIGVALAMLREQIERSIMSPSSEDIKRIRLDVTNKIVENGAKPETVQVEVQIDSQKNILTATATGASEFRNESSFGTKIDKDKLRGILAKGYDVHVDAVKELDGNKSFTTYELIKNKKMLFGLIKKNEKNTCIVKNDGVVLNKFNDGKVTICSKKDAHEHIKFLIEDVSTYTDAGKSIPKMHMFSDFQHYDYSGLINEEQVMTMFKLDLDDIAMEEKLIITAMKM
jgi:N-methylhydantoinase A